MRKNTKDSESKIEILRRGAASEFWDLLCEALDESIEHLQKLSDGDEVGDLPADKYKLQMELLKAKKYYLKRLKEYPAILINQMNNPDFDEKSFDPYE